MIDGKKNRAEGMAQSEFLIWVVAKYASIAKWPVLGVFYLS
jgi:hypothetical protein